MVIRAWCRAATLAVSPHLGISAPAHLTIVTSAVNTGHNTRRYYICTTEASSLPVQCRPDGDAPVLAWRLKTVPAGGSASAEDEII